MADIKFIPGVHPTYKEQFDKLTMAYISGNVRPYDECACFVGNLLNNAKGWVNMRESSTYDLEEGLEVILIPDVVKHYAYLLAEEAAGLYTPEEIFQLEARFLKVIHDFTSGECLDSLKYEDALFMAFELTLKLLREIHESKGEIIDEVPAFTKRELKTA